MSATAETLPTTQTATPLPQVVPVNERDAAFNLAFRQAKALSSSDLVPQSYRNNIPNTMLALSVANRIGADPFAVMQNLHLIQGRPSWSSTFLIATVNASRRFEPMRFEVQGEDPAHKEYRVRAYAKDRESGTLCLGTWITWKMVEAEGWSKKSGSKWLTMPGQMFLYRAAAFWARVYAPEVSIGLHTVEEVQDFAGGPQVTTFDHATNSPEQVGALKSALTALEAPAKTEPAPEYDKETGELLPPNL